MVDDTGEECMHSDDLENVYDEIRNLESMDSDNVVAGDNHYTSMTGWPCDPEGQVKGMLQNKNL